MQWAKIMGSKRVVVFDIDEARLALAKRLGADEVINTIQEGFMEKAISFTGGKGYDYVFETAGNPVTMLMAFEAAANKAHVCYISTPTKDVVFTPKKMELMNRKEFKLTGSWMSYSKKKTLHNVNAKLKLSLALTRFLSRRNAKNAKQDDGNHRNAEIRPQGWYLLML